MKKILLFLVFLYSIPALSQDGTVDLTFGSSGFSTVTPPSGPVFNDISKTCALPDGKLLKCFSVYNSSTANLDFALVKYDADGNLDVTFDGDAGNGNGIVLSDFGGDDVATSLTVQSDGKIVVAGYRKQAGVNVFAIARYNANGTSDLTWDGNGGNGNGKFITTIGTDDAAYGVIESNGKIIVVGYATIGVNQLMAVVRYNGTNGVLDTGFDGDGKLTTSFGGSVEVAYSVKVQRDLKIIVAGTSFNGASVFAMARYNLNGSLDTSFDTDGRVTTVIGSDDVAYDVGIHDPSGKIILAGSSFNGSNTDFAMALYGPDGSLDPYWNGNGKVTLDINGGDDVAYSLIVQSNLKVLLSGTSYNGSNLDFAVARFNKTATLDVSFNPSASAPAYPGLNLIDFAGNDYCYGSALQGSNIILGGITGISVALTRIINTGIGLPVKLVDFTASRQSSSVQLNWVTSTEEQSAFFDVQRSEDGRTFRSIGQVQAKGNTSGNSLYMFIDQNPGAGAHFYRLKMVDVDGTSALSRTLALRFDVSAGISIFPNPVSDRLNVQLTSIHAKRLQLVDASGRTIRNISIDGEGSGISMQIDLTSLSRGMYMIRAGDASASFIKK